MFNQRRGPMTMGFLRIGGYSALAFLATVIAANVVLLAAHPPAVDADPASVSGFVDRHSSSIAIASALAVMAWPMLFTFGAALTGFLTPVDGRRHDVWPTVGLAGIIMNTIFFGGSVVALLSVRPNTGDVAGLWRLHNAFFTINGVALATAMVGYSAAGFRTGMLSRRTIAVGGTGAGLQLLQALSVPVALGSGDFAGAVQAVGAAGFVLWLVWLVLVAVGLIRADLHSSAVARPSSDLPRCLPRLRG